MVCITTPTFSLSLNGEMFGFFRGKRGLRQGDPLSPLIFALCMEYLTRTLRYAATVNNFKYHPLCKEMKLANMMFADDVLLFYKGEVHSMLLILKSLKTFSNASGLTISSQKSTAYFRGISTDTKKDILRVSGFSEGKLPFTYLGMPIQTTRLQKKHCESLVERICDRIHNYGARKFSYAGRLVLVNAVLTSLHSYWASMFVLPKGILARIEATCRHFLWDNGPDYRKPPLVAWNTACQPKAEGGLGIRNLELSNVAMIGRLVDWVAQKKDSLWVKWVYTHYIKDQDWMDYQPSTNSSWVWRKVCAVKHRLASGYSEGNWTIQPQGYTPSGCYEWLRGRGQPQVWADAIWNDWVLPKHQFFGWLNVHGGLRTRDKLKRLGVLDEDSCSICGQGTETKDHLFLNCTYSIRVVTEIQQETGILIPKQQHLEWIMAGDSTVQRHIRASMIQSICYTIWQQRNRGRLESCITSPRVLARQILHDFRQRIRRKLDCNVSIDDRNWIMSNHLV
ncbi:hypothetical protein vseg_000934 [Gypsophila vaccaria]